MKIKPPMDAYRWGLCAWDERRERFESLQVLWEQSPTTPKPPPLPEGHPVTWRDATGKVWLLFGNPLPTLKCPATFEAWQNSNTWITLQPQATLAVAGSTNRVKPHSGSIAWHGWRQRWVTVFTESFGRPSAFGEVWYAETEQPTGPWGAAVKILSHDNYTFYNPRLHPEFTATNSPSLMFEGTFSQMFADRPAPTPRYDYNQILYRLDLDDPRLRPATNR
jgi:hypothetical protein